MSHSLSVLTNHGIQRVIQTSATTSSSIIQKAVRFESIALEIAFPAGAGLMITGGYENGKSLIFRKQRSS